MISLCYLEQLISPGSLVTGAAETGGDERVDNTGLDIRDTPRLGEPPPPGVRALGEDQNILLLDLQYTTHNISSTLCTK